MRWCSAISRSRWRRRCATTTGTATGCAGSTRASGEGGFWRGRWGIALALLPPLLAVGLFQLALARTAAAAWSGSLFGIVVLFYAWGPRDLDLDVEAIVDARDAAARRAAVARLWPEGETPATLDGAALVEAVFRNALQRWFGVLFWFLLLGPVGALLYRLAALSARRRDRAHAARAKPAVGARKLLAHARLAGGAADDAVAGAGRQLRHRARRLARGAAVPRSTSTTRSWAPPRVPACKCELAEEAADYADDGGSAEVGEGGLPTAADAAAYDVCPNCATR